MAITIYVQLWLTALPTEPDVDARALKRSRINIVEDSVDIPNPSSSSAAPVADQPGKNVHVF
jgi:hypothetical protein